ncbi:MAG: IS3 family transposase [Candidatus Synoicihabitans palmerolidicus]|nr:IS3 family transposase [Candidatus Synoicihabitans palmerolidicus]
MSERLPEVFAKPSAQVRDEIERNRKEREGTVCADRAAADGARGAQKQLAHLESKERRSMIETEHPKLSVARQCELWELPRSTYYHHPKPPKEADLALMKQIDEIYLESPFFGSRQMTRWLQREGHVVNRKRVRRLMGLMGLTAIYPKPSLSKKAASPQIYPYLLRTRKVERSNHVWATDIIYIPVCDGFVYLSAVIDWHSRRVLAWELSNTLDASFCERCSARWRFTASRRSATPTKAACLPAPSSPSHCWPPACDCRWTEKDGAWTMSWSNACGAASNTKKSI